MNRATKSGFAREAQDKINSKYNESHASEVMKWVSKVIGTELDTSGSQDSVHEAFKDGSNLLKLINAIIPGKFQKVKNQKMPFQQREQIALFNEAIKGQPFCIHDASTFQTTDLYECMNMHQVIICLEAVGRKCHSVNPTLEGFGPKESLENKRTFTDEQLKQGQSIIGLQMGSNKGATQAGQNFGKARHIVD